MVDDEMIQPQETLADKFGRVMQDATAVLMQDAPQQQSSTSGSVMDPEPENKREMYDQVNRLREDQASTMSSGSIEQDLSRLDTAEGELAALIARNPTSPRRQAWEQMIESLEEVKSELKDAEEKKLEKEKAQDGRAQDNDGRTVEQVVQEDIGRVGAEQNKAAATEKVPTDLNTFSVEERAVETMAEMPVAQKPMRNSKFDSLLAGVELSGLAVPSSGNLTTGMLPQDLGLAQTTAMSKVAPKQQQQDSGFSRSPGSTAA